MKKPNFKIGRTFDGQIIQTEGNVLQNKPETPKGRRADPRNPNRIMTFGFGFGTEKGTIDEHIKHRGQNSYNDMFGEKIPDTT
jgi:hypothetical protein